MFGLGSFETNVLIGACITMIVLLALIGYLLSKSNKSNKEWPPSIGVCPDYWEDETGTGKKCKNVHKLGRCGDMSGPGGDGSDGYDLTWYAEKKNRCYTSKALKDICHLSWDGITNDDNACATGPSDDNANKSSSMPRFLIVIVLVIVIISVVYLMMSGGKKGGPTSTSASTYTSA
jgi:hypothetical protein